MKKKPFCSLSSWLWPRWQLNLSAGFLRESLSGGSTWRAHLQSLSPCSLLSARCAG
jgi:hypothetical protein